MSIKFNPDVKLYSGMDSRINIEHKDLEIMINMAETLAQKEREEEHQMKLALITAQKTLVDAKAKLQKTNFRNRKARKAVHKAQQELFAINNYFEIEEDNQVEIDFSEDEIDFDERAFRLKTEENAILNKKLE